ncbi:hypothetical protein BH09PAT4_BH09PAT4_04360 [soil metagenome]
MSESLKVASWNVRDGLSTPVVMPAVVERIKGLEADIVVLPEAFNEGAKTGDEFLAEVLDQASDQLRGAGYAMHRVRYDDTDGRKDRHGFALLTRVPEAGDVKVFDLGGRNALGQYVGDLALTVVGLHLDDRAEATRITQTARLLDQLDFDAKNLALGDFNAMHRKDPKAVALRLAKPVARLLPSVDPGETAPNLAKLRRAGSLSSRLTDMATGSTMGYLWANGYEDVDTQFQPTKSFVQLDHIMTNFEHAEPSSDVRVGEYSVHEVPGHESDHRPISAVIEY